MLRMLYNLIVPFYDYPVQAHSHVFSRWHVCLFLIAIQEFFVYEGSEPLASDICWKYSTPLSAFRLAHLFIYSFFIPLFFLFFIEV